jgi:hypothetical protein
VRLVTVIVLFVALAACGPPEDDPIVREPPPVPDETPPTEDEPPEPMTPPELADWSRGAQAPVALTEVAGASLGGELWTAGGLTADGRATDAVLVYDPTFDAWGDAPALPEAVHHAALVSTGDGLWLVGGYTGDGFGTPTDAVWRLDMATGTWQRGPFLPEARAAGAGAWDGRRLVYGGGVGPDGLSGDVFALEDGSWRVLGELSEPREHLAAAGDVEGSVWFLGGRTGGLDTNLTAVDAVQGDEIARVGELPTARGGLAAFWVPEIGACAVGGEAPERTFGDVECIAEDGTVTVLPALEVPRHGLAAGVVDGVVIVGLGGPEPGLHVSAVVERLVVDG